MANTVNNGILNEYVKKPINLTEYTAFRGVTDFTQIGQFSQFETGYSFLALISMPKYIEALAKQGNDYVKNLINLFQHTLEYEFRSLDGLPDIGSENATITNGIQEINMINKVTRDTAVTISMPYFEKTGSPITKFCEYYLSGIKDPTTQAKTYHGLIANGLMNADYENEVFTLMYMVTDNTYLELEKAVLISNAQITKCENIYNSTKGEISNKEISIEMQCFPVTGAMVDKAAKKMLQQITGVKVTQANGIVRRSIDTAVRNPVVLDSASYDYKVLSEIKDV